MRKVIIQLLCIEFIFRWPSLVPNNLTDPEGTTQSLTNAKTTTTITTKVLTTEATSASPSSETTVGACFRKPPPPLPPRQMSLPTPLISRHHHPLHLPPLLPEIEDEDEESATSTTPTPKAASGGGATSTTARSSVTSVGAGVFGNNITLEDNGSIASPMEAVNTRNGSCTTGMGHLPSEEIPMQITTCTMTSVIADIVFKEANISSHHHHLPPQGPHQVINSQPSQISLSSWSSTASVATRTNTDNPSSMSHIVTNFNISRTAAAAVHQSSSGSASSDTTTTARRSTTSTGGGSSSKPSSQQPIRLTTYSTTTVTEARREPAHATAAAEADNDNNSEESTPLKVFKQTPV